MELMSQIPTQISGLVGKNYRPRKVKFSEVDYINVDSSSSTDEEEEEEDNRSTDHDVSTTKVAKSNIKGAELKKPTTGLLRKGDIEPTKRNLVESTKLVPESVKRKAESTDRLVESTKRCVELADAITDTTGLGPKLCDTGTQTDISSFSDDYDIHRRNSQDNFASIHRPMYSIPKRKGQLPPLKLGLTLPKGKKRRVFYPGEDRLD